MVNQRKARIVGFGVVLVVVTACTAWIMLGTLAIVNSHHLDAIWGIGLTIILPMACIGAGCGLTGWYLIRLRPEPWLVIPWLVAFCLVAVLAYISAGL